MDDKKEREGLGRKHLFLPFQAILQVQDKMFRWETKKKVKTRGLDGWIFPFSHGDFWSEPIRSEISASVLLKGKVRGKGERSWPRSPREPHDPFPMWHIPEPRRGEGRGAGRVGLGAGRWTVAPAQRHPVFPPGRRLQAKGKAEDRYACVPKLLWWFMASSRLLCKGWSWPRRPKETVSEIKSRWRYVLETPRFRGWNLAQRIWYLLFSRPFGDFVLAYMLVRGFWFVTGPEKMPR